MPAEAKLTLAIPTAAASTVRLRKSGMSVRARDKKSRRGMESERNPCGARSPRFILRESYRRNVRKFEIVTSRSRICVCVNESTLILDQETLD